MFGALSSCSFEKNHPIWKNALHKKKEINSNTQMSKNYFEIMMTKIMFKYIKV